MNFDQYITLHRNLLKLGIRSAPQLFKERDLQSFDLVASQVKTRLIKEGVIDYFQPVLFLKDPMEFLKLTEKTIFETVYIKGNLLNEGEYTEEDIALEANKALQSQLSAVKNLKDFYEKVKTAGKIGDLITLDDEGQFVDFKNELDDIEQELDAIYGKLERFGLLAKMGAGLKKAFGWMQRGAGEFGAGHVSDQDFRRGFELEENLDEGIWDSIKDVVRPALGIGAAAATGIGGGVAALLTAGAAGAKMVQRRKRIEKLVARAIEFKRRNPEFETAALTKPAIEPEVETITPRTAAAIDSEKPHVALTPATVAASTSAQEVPPVAQMPVKTMPPAAKASEPTPTPKDTIAAPTTSFKSEFIKRMFKQSPGLAKNPNARKELDDVYNDLIRRFGQEAAKMAMGGANPRARKIGSSLQENFRITCLPLLLEKCTLNEASGKLYNLGYQIFAQMIKEPQFAHIIQRVQKKAEKAHAKIGPGKEKSDLLQKSQTTGIDSNLLKRSQDPEVKAKIAALKAKRAASTSTVVAPEKSKKRVKTTAVKVPPTTQANPAELEARAAAAREAEIEADRERLLQQQVETTLREMIKKLTKITK